MLLTAQSSFSFGEEPDHGRSARGPSTRVRPGGNVSIDLSDNGSSHTSRQNSISSNSSRQNIGGNTHIQFGDDTNYDGVDRTKPAATRVIHPGGTGGKSSIDFDNFDAPIRPNHSGRNGAGGSTSIDLSGESSEHDACSAKERLSSRILNPGGTGGKSRIVLGGETPDATSNGHNGTGESSRAQKSGGSGGYSSAVFGDERPDHDPDATRLTSRVLQPGGTGGASSIAFVDDGTGSSPPASLSGSTRGGVRADPGSNVFDDSNDEAGSNCSGSPPRSRRNDNNTSIVAFGDDGGANPAESTRKNDTRFRVLQPGGTGGRSNIQFSGDSVDQLTKGEFLCRYRLGDLVLFSFCRCMLTNDVYVKRHA